MSPCSQNSGPPSLSPPSILQFVFGTGTRVENMQKLIWKWNRIGEAELSGPEEDGYPAARALLCRHPSRSVSSYILKVKESNLESQPILDMEIECKSQCSDKDSNEKKYTSSTPHPLT